MKFLKNLLMVVVLIGASLCTFAQGNMSIEKGNVLINPSVSLGWYDYGYSSSLINIIPPVALNFEYASSDYLSFGLEAEYGLRRYVDNFTTFGDLDYKYEYKNINFRGSFHYLELVKNLLEDKIGGFNSEKIDFYVGASTGLFWTTLTEEWAQEGSTGLRHERKSFESSWRFGYFAGFRYYFSDNFGAFIETGKNPLGWVKAGLTLKF